MGHFTTLAILTTSSGQSADKSRCFPSSVEEASVADGGESVSVDQSMEDPSGDPKMLAGGGDLPASSTSLSKASTSPPLPSLMDCTLSGCP